MTGVINVYKEKGCSSFHIVYEIRKLTGEKKAGHTGTLDPDAEGVLPVCVGKATKLVDFLMDTDKSYRAELVFGKATDTQDVSGNVVSEMPPDEVRKVLSKEKIEGIFQRFTGEVMQVPPMYSALKVNGEKLVNAARKGREVERQARPVNVYGFENIEISDDLLHVFFTVNCSKGTYVRTLCEDMGRALGCPACMGSLVRTRTSNLNADTARTLDEIKRIAGEGNLEEILIPTDAFLERYPRAVVKREAVPKLIFGNYLRNSEVTPERLPARVFRMYDEAGEFYALYEYSEGERIYKCVKMFRDI